MDMNDTTEFCTACQIHKPVADFYPRPECIKRPYSYNCKDCKKAGRNRQDEYWNELLKKHKTICQYCGIPRKLVTDDKCKRCLTESGFRICSKCKGKKLLFLDFYPKRKECVDCTVQQPEGVERCAAGKWHSIGRCKCRKTPKRLWPCDQKEHEHYRRTARNAQLQRSYGITLEEFNRMEKEQGGVCAICASPPRHNRALSVDHNHLTGKIRKLLCQNCNAALGMFKDDPERLIRAADYLRTLS
jgi:hypothetical protein